MWVAFGAYAIQIKNGCLGELDYLVNLEKLMRGGTSSCMFEVFGSANHSLLLQNFNF